MRKCAFILSATAALTACGEQAGVAPQRMADAIFAVIEADRAAYTTNVVNRLQNEEAVIKADEHWKDSKALPLPAQMLRMGAERVAEQGAGFNYALLSQWAINKQNKPRTDLERQGLEFIVENPGKNFYGTETLAGTEYFTAIYPDVAVSPACVSCHNEHVDSPRTDFELGQTMGGVVIRFAL
ncbi:Tll0287-like domain-containing protein [Microbulbifer sp. SA54]|uniref:Tll0287-like domain-containing protein n=1 Tax=Microbulbifer sp. SA54 TaxID=3401577 RepID=UPI003AB0915D